MQIIFFLAASFLTSNSEAQWQNKPANLTTALDCSFDGGLCPGMFNGYRNEPFITDASAPISPGVLDYHLPAGALTGGGEFGYSFDANQRFRPKEVYVGTWWKTNPEFDGNVNGGNKMIFIRSDTEGGNFLNWSGGVEGPKDLLFATQQAVAPGNCHLMNWSGSAWLGKPCDGVFPSGTHGFFYNNVGSGLVGPGTGWHKIEIYQRVSTSWTSRDGIIRMWVDGRLVLDLTTVNLVPGGFSDVQYNSTWDGSSNMQCNVRDCRRERHHYYDHLFIAYGGGTGTPPPPPPPTTPPPPPPPTVAAPGAVTNLAASQIGPTSLTLSFTQVSDGAGAPASYNIRYGPAGAGWGELSAVSQGTCVTPLQGTATSGTLTCSVAGLSPSTSYVFQLVAFRGTLNQGAVYGGLSNAAAAQTSQAPAPTTDINRDGSTNVTDVQLCVNQAVGGAACGTGDINGDGVCNVVDVQKVVNATFGI